MRTPLVDPAKRFVARELEARWNGALEKVVEIERRIEELRATAAARSRRADHAPLVALGTFDLRGIASPCAVFALLET